MKKLLLTTVLCAFLTGALQAQSIGPSVLNTGGGSATIGGNTYEYAIGDITNGAMLSSPALVVTQGVLQPVSTTSVGHSPAAITGLQVYPSPVQSVLYLQPAFTGAGRLQYALYDATGKLVFEAAAVLATGTEWQEVAVSSLAAGQYILNVQWLSGSSSSAGAYKIQKLR